MIEILLQAEGALSVGLLDRAETLYRQVALADPRNSIAVVGLARVALERGDEPGALAMARRALAIDAENAAAQRMIRRLEEVLTFRAENIPAAPDRAATLPVVPTPEAVTTPEAGPTPEAVPLPEAPPPQPAHISTEPEPKPSPPSPPTFEGAPRPPRAEEPHRRSLVDRFLRRG